MADDLIFDLTPEINEEEIENLKKRLHKVRAGQEVTIFMETADAHQADRIVDILKEQGFDYQPRGGHGNEYYLIGKKKSST